MKTLGVFVKQPAPGQTKTRLAERIGAIAAAEFALAMLDDALEACRPFGDRRVIGFSPPAATEFFRPYESIGYELWSQPDGDLGHRMTAFFESYATDDDDHVVLVGTDSPTMPRNFIDESFRLLKSHDCVLGPATDGGYYLIGLRRSRPELFAGMVFSQPTVLHQTCERIEALGLSLALLPPWYDIDTMADLDCLVGHLHAMRIAGIETGCPATEALIRRLDCR